jgi:signal peptidase II
MQWVALIAVTIVGIDQLTKWLVVHAIDPEEPRVIISGFFSIVQVHNTGAAWGMFKDYNLVLTVISVLAVAGIFLFRRTFQLHRAGLRAAFGLVAGGILGNLIDRVRVHHVIDFLSFYCGPYHLPAFNVADSAICVGVGLYVVLSWRSNGTAEKPQAAISS